MTLSRTRMAVQWQYHDDVMGARTFRGRTWASTNVHGHSWHMDIHVMGIHGNAMAMP